MVKRELLSETDTKIVKIDMNNGYATVKELKSDGFVPKL